MSGRRILWFSAGALVVVVIAVAAIRPPGDRDSRPAVAVVERAAAVSLSPAETFGSVALLAAGDIAHCSSNGDEATAAVLDAQQSGIVITLGDNVYETGTAAEFTNCYGPSWGRHLSRTRPSVGNHEYGTTGASGYFGYFGAAAGDPAKGYYSYDYGNWHIIAINTNCSVVGGCRAGSALEQWLRADLAAHPKACTLAYGHHPRFSSGDDHGNVSAMQPLWQALYDFGAEIALGGHDHTYERFAPQTPAGAANATGIRSFVVGTGGRSHYGFNAPEPNSEVRNGDTYGVLKLTLSAASYAWEFLPESGKIFTDAGSGVCHSVDRDGDGPVDDADNCPTLANASQADADGDGVGDTCEASVYATDAADADSDDDGCRDGTELWAAEFNGGWRSPTNGYDFFDVTGDRAIDLRDTLLVLAHFGHTASGDAVDDALDRRIPQAWEPWRAAGDNNGVDLFDAITNLRSFGHDCVT